MEQEILTKMQSEFAAKFGEQETRAYFSPGRVNLMGPCWATIYAETLKTVEKKYTETAGAVLVMSIIGGAVVPAVQGYVSDITGSMQLSFIVNFLCFAYVGYYFYQKNTEAKEAHESDLSLQH